MSNLNEEVPETVKIATGHLCGAVFVLLSAFTFWAIYRLALDPHPGILVVIAMSSAAAWFFAVLAIKLTAGRWERSTRTLLLRTMKGVVLLVILLLVLATIRYISS